MEDEVERIFDKHTKALQDELLELSKVSEDPEYVITLARHYGIYIGEVN